MYQLVLLEGISGTNFKKSAQKTTRKFAQKAALLNCHPGPRDVRCRGRRLCRNQAYTQKQGPDQGRSGLDTAGNIQRN